MAPGEIESWKATAKKLELQNTTMSEQNVRACDRIRELASDKRELRRQLAEQERASTELQRKALEEAEKILLKSESLQAESHKHQDEIETKYLKKERDTMQRLREERAHWSGKVKAKAEEQKSKCKKEFELERQQYLKKEQQLEVTISELWGKYAISLFSIQHKFNNEKDQSSKKLEKALMQLMDKRIM